MITQPESLLPQVARDLRVEETLLRRHLLSRSLCPVPGVPQYLRFRQPCGPVEEGTMVFLGAGASYLRGFPKIRRVYNLAAGLGAHFKGEFYAEEKMDGYNVRVALADGKLVAATKGGLVCPYTTQKLQGADNGFLRKNPELMLCGEVVGLANPYQTKSYPHARDFGFFVFDIRDRTTGEPFKPGERYAAVEEYGLNGVQVLGKFAPRDGGKLLKLVRKLGDDGREGMVLKSLDGRTCVKYTSNQSTNSDLRYAFKFPFDYGQAFFFRRLIREAFQVQELGLKGKELSKEAARLGENILVPMVETITAITEGKEVTEDFDLVVPSREFAQEFVEHLVHLGVRATIASVKKEGKQYRARVSRHYQSTNDKTRSYLRGEFGGE